MPFLHKHNFIESTNDKEMLFCTCGKVKDIHRHKWEQYRIVENKLHEEVGLILTCSTCGVLLNHKV